MTNRPSQTTETQKRESDKSLNCHFYSPVFSLCCCCSGYLSLLSRWNAILFRCNFAICSRDNSRRGSNGGGDADDSHTESVSHSQAQQILRFCSAEQCSFHGVSHFIIRISELTSSGRHTRTFFFEICNCKMYRLFFVLFASDEKDACLLFGSIKNDTKTNLHNKMKWINPRSGIEQPDAMIAILPSIFWMRMRRNALPSEWCWILCRNLNGVEF